MSRTAFSSAIAAYRARKKVDGTAARKNQPAACHSTSFTYATVREAFDTNCTAANSGTASTGAMPIEYSTAMRMVPPPRPATPDSADVTKATAVRPQARVVIRALCGTRPSRSQDQQRRERQHQAHARDVGAGGEEDARGGDRVGADATQRQ